MIKFLKRLLGVQERPTGYDNFTSRALAYERACDAAVGDKTKPEGKGKVVGVPRLTDESRGNAYGSVWVEYENGKQSTVICGHGGSMWMCLDCADAAVRGLPGPRPETNRFRL